MTSQFVKELVQTCVMSMAIENSLIQTSNDIIILIRLYI